MKTINGNGAGAAIVRHPFTAFIVCLFAILAVLFRGSLKAGSILFSNDAPLGVISCDALRLPSALSGVWFDLNSIGSNWGAFAPNATSALRWMLGPVGFAKFYAPLALCVVGLGAWTFYRRAGMGFAACFAGGVAAVLNGDFFSVACWGVGAQAICFGFNFLALAALTVPCPALPWLRFALAGLAVGVGVTEGIDIGAIFSLCVAAFVVYSSWTGQGAVRGRLLRAAGTVLLVATFAAPIAAQAIAGMVQTQIRGVVGTAQDGATKAQRWDWATQWSLPKREALGIIIPGLYGYRMDTPGGGAYWGGVGRDAAWDRYFTEGGKGPPPRGILRYSGGGIYAGLPVVVIALWAALQALRRRGSIFSNAERKLLWFWMGVALVALMLAFGRFGFMYRFLYALPYCSTIRNPTKLCHVFTFALLVLFGYGVDALWRGHLLPVGSAVSGSFKEWWTQAGRFDRGWAIGCVVGTAAGLLGWCCYASERVALIRHLVAVQFDTDQAELISGFSVRQVGWFVLFLALTSALLLLILSGLFSGTRARLGAWLLTLVVMADLTRADVRWIVYWDCKSKYASNPIVDLLGDHAHEHRVAELPPVLIEPWLAGRPEVAALERVFLGLYRTEWMQHLLPYHNVQSLDIVQMPRVREDLSNFEIALSPSRREDVMRLACRRWQLTNTRYLLGPAGCLDFLNERADPVQGWFRLAARFDLVPKPGVVCPTRLEEIVPALSASGRMAILELGGALPRAKMYSSWRVVTDEGMTRKELGGGGFDPEKTVLVARDLPATPVAMQQAGSVEFVSYAPKDIVLDARGLGPSVLLLNDHFDPDWHVFVDGKPDVVLRCNYIMRGVFLPAGRHVVRFAFRPSVVPLYVSLAAIAVGVLLCGLLFVTPRPGVSWRSSGGGARWHWGKAVARRCRPIVSICIPCYNGAEFIARTVRSALAQTFGDYEVIVSDDGSTDGTVSIVGDFADPRIRLFRNERNLGVTRNWQRALLLASGKYVKFLPQDDLLYPGCLARQVAILEDPLYSRASLAICGSEVIDAADRVVLRRPARFHPGFVDGRLVVRRCVRWGTNVMGEPVAGLFRRESVDASRVFGSENPFLFDMELWTALLRRGGAVVDPSRLVAFRVSRSSLSMGIGLRQPAFFMRFARRVRADGYFGVTRLDLAMAQALSLQWCLVRNGFTWLTSMRMSIGARSALKNAGFDAGLRPSPSLKEAGRFGQMHVKAG